MSPWPSMNMYFPSGVTMGQSPPCRLLTFSPKLTGAVSWGSKAGREFAVGRRPDGWSPESFDSIAFRETPYFAGGGIDTGPRPL